MGGIAARKELGKVRQGAGYPCRTRVSPVREPDVGAWNGRGNRRARQAPVYRSPAPLHHVAKLTLTPTYNYVKILYTLYFILNTLYCSHMQGFILIDKPTDWTSHDVVNRVRKLTGERKVGHAGTLDPFATGLLIIGVGKKYTKQLGELIGLNKEYEATFVLGATSATDDPEGPITERRATCDVRRAQIEEAMKKYMGEIDQVPPRFAAIKKDGKKLYEKARAGEEFEPESRKVRVDEYELLKTSDDNHKLKVRIKCGSGTYIRALARDLGNDLGVGGYVSELRRTRVGDFDVSDSTPLEELAPNNIESKIFQKEEAGSR